MRTAFYYRSKVIAAELSSCLDTTEHALSLDDWCVADAVELASELGLIIGALQECIRPKSRSKPD
jgi:hypothetical protein